MFSRHDIPDADWRRIEHLLPGRPGQHGGVGIDNRLLANAVRYLARTGVAWADLPTHFGKPNSLWQRHNRWCEKGVWQRIAAELRDADAEWLCVDSSCVRAAAAAAGAKKNGAARAGSRPRRRGAGAAGSARRFAPS